MFERKPRGRSRNTRNSNKSGSKITRTANRWQMQKNSNSNSAISKSGVDKSSVKNETFAAKRVTTVPLGFFSRGIKSKTVSKKTAIDNVLSRSSRDFLNEDLHALLQTVSENDTQDIQSPDCVTVRRSKRLSAQDSKNQMQYNSVADYYLKLQSDCDFKENIPEQTANNSLFKEISSQFQKTLEQSPTKQDKTRRSFESESSEGVLNNLWNSSAGIDSEPFCKNLKKQLSSAYLNSRKAKCLGKIKTLTKQIDAVLIGSETNINLKAEPKGKTEFSKPNDKFSVSRLIPKSGWLYRTPANQKLKPSDTDTPAPNKPKTWVKLDSNLEEVSNISTLNKLATSVSVNNDPTFGTVSLKTVTKYNAFEHRSQFQENFRTSHNRTSFYGTVSEFPPLSNDDPILTKFTSHFCHEETENEETLLPFSYETNQNKKEGFCRFLQDFDFLSASSGFVANYPQPGNMSNAVTSEIPFRYPVVTNDIPKRNYRLPSDPSSCERAFVYDEDFLLPSKPDLTEPSSLKFYPRKIFDSE